jgi:hypothetical protein
MRRIEKFFQNSFTSQSNVENYSPQVQKLLTEWEQDCAMARERDVTGREPEARPLPEMSQRAKCAPKSPTQRQRGKAIEIPF